MSLRTFRTRAVALAAVGALTLTGTALAAHPKASKKYGGTTTEAKVHGKRPTVTFKVASNGRKLVNFTYQTAGCFTGGGETKQRLGTLAVSGSGAFSARALVTRITTGARTLVTKSSVSGTFKSAGAATGTITYTQSVVVKGGPTIKPCGPRKLSFTAKVASPSTSSGITGGY